MVAGDVAEERGVALPQQVGLLEQRALQRAAEVSAQHAGRAAGQLGLGAGPEGGVGAAGAVGLAQQARAAALDDQRGGHQAGELGKDQQARPFGLGQAHEAHQVLLQFLPVLRQADAQLHNGGDEFVHGCCLLSVIA